VSTDTTPYTWPRAGQETENNLSASTEQADKSQTVNVRGRQVPYLQRWIRRRDYYLLKQIGSPLRERYLAFDPYCGGGRLFLVQVWPLDANPQYLRSSHLKNDCLPRAVVAARANSIDVLTWVEGISLTNTQNIHDGHGRPWTQLRLSG
jgi:hypothetical protein